MKKEKSTKKRGKKAFKKKLLLQQICFYQKKEKFPRFVKLDPILDDEGFCGVKLALEDNLTTGRFLGHD